MSAATPAARAAARAGDQAWNKQTKVNAELFALTYGALLRQLLEDFEDSAAVNAQLDRMGSNIGVRLVEEYLAKVAGDACADLKETAEAVGRTAFKMFLGISADVGRWAADGRSFSIVLHENPLSESAELPADRQDLVYCNVLCGVIRGALEAVGLDVSATYARDTLKGDEVDEIRISLNSVLEASGFGEEYQTD